MAYKALKSVRGIPQGRDALRMMQKFGLKTSEISGVNTVIIRRDNEEIVIQQPTVTTITIQGEKIYQIVGGSVSERSTVTESPIEIPESDVKLVVDQTGCSLEEARGVLNETGGDLARAIMNLQERKKSGRP